jgi:hypothetical protein
VEVEVGELVRVGAVVDLGGIKGGLDGAGGAGDVGGEERELGGVEFEEFVHVAVVSDDAAAGVGLLFEEVERRNLKRGDLDHEGVEAFVFAAV